MKQPTPLKLNLDLVHRYTLVPRTGQTVVQTGLTSHALRHREYASVDTPGWPRTIRDNSFSLHVLRFNYAGVKGSRIFKPHVPYVSDTFESNGFNPNDWYGPNIHYQNYNLHQDVYPRLVAKHIGEVVDSKVNLPVLLAEANKSARLIVETAQRLARAIKAAKRLDAATLGRELGVFDTKAFSARQSRTKTPRNSAKQRRNRNGFDVADPAFSLWLQFQYGWKPLLSEVKGAAEHLARVHLSSPRGFNVDTRVSQGFFFRNPDLVFRWGSAYEIHEGITHARMRTTWLVADDFTRSAAQLKIQDPLLLAWELLPFSFVADWFLPIGNYLSALNYKDGLTYKGGFWHYRTPSTTRFEPTGLPMETPDAQCRLTGAGVLREEYRFTRTPLPLPPVNRFPTFEFKFSSAKALTSIALLKTVF